MPGLSSSSFQGPKCPQVYSLVADGRRKVQSTFPDGSEMIEEYDVEDDCLLLRKTRKKCPFGKEGAWEYEIGAPATSNSGLLDDEPARRNDEVQLQFMVPTAVSPFCVMLDAKKAFEWRIRNLPYPTSTYNVAIDEETQEVVVRTTNKKYFKRLPIKSMSNLGLRLSGASLTWTHQHNTLIIRYLKPEKVIEYENARLLNAKKSSATLN